MLDFVQSDLVDLDDEGKESIAQIAATLSAEANLVWRQDEVNRDRKAGTLAKGVEALQTTFTDYSCIECHKFHDVGEDSAPDLTGYGSYEWLYGFISDPTQERFYGEDGNDRMPAFAEHADSPELNRLSPHDIDMLVRWLRGDDRNLLLKLKKAASSATPETPAPGLATGSDLTETDIDETEGANTAPGATEAKTDPDANTGN